MIATTHREINGNTYDRWTVNLAVTGKYNVNGEFDASIALRLIPTRIVPASTDGEESIPAHVETAEGAAVGMLRGRLTELRDGDEAAAVEGVKSAIAAYLAAKGL